MTKYRYSRDFCYSKLRDILFEELPSEQILKIMTAYNKVIFATKEEGECICQKLRPINTNCPIHGVIRQINDEGKRIREGREIDLPEAILQVTDWQGLACDVRPNSGFMEWVREVTKAVNDLQRSK